MSYLQHKAFLTTSLIETTPARNILNQQVAQVETGMSTNMKALVEGICLRCAGGRRTPGHMRMWGSVPRGKCVVSVN